MKIGCDVDGVLADFNTRFIERVVRETGRDLFPPRPFDIPCWNYPTHYGYTREEESSVWNGIKQDRGFWLGLDAYDYAPAIIERLRVLSVDHDVYFITSRPGLQTKTQTEVWLSTRSGDFLWTPTVLVSSEKGMCARALQLDAYIDDNWDNCVDVAVSEPNGQTFCLDRPWNKGRTSADIMRVTEPGVMLDVMLGPGAGMREAKIAA